MSALDEMLTADTEAEALELLHSAGCTDGLPVHIKFLAVWFAWKNNLKFIAWLAALMTGVSRLRPKTVSQGESGPNRI